MEPTNKFGDHPVNGGQAGKGNGEEGGMKPQGAPGAEAKKAKAAATKLWLLTATSPKFRGSHKSGLV